MANAASAASTPNSGATPFSCRISFFLTDFCGNLLFCLIGSYLLYFYTDVFGLPVTVTGMLLLLTRILDAIDAPVWGSIVDHTHSKYGRSRPWFLWLAIPFAVSMWLTFTTPTFLSETGKIVYAVFTYLIAGIVYSGVQTAITSILPNLTNNHSERMVLNTFRMVGGSVGAFISMTFALPLVKLLGQGDQQLGFSLTVGMFAIVVVILLFFAFRHLREQNVERNVSIPVKDSIRALKNNWPWIILVSVNLFVWICISVRQGTLIYYCKYVLNNEDITALLNGVLMITCLISFLVMALVVRYTKKFGAMILGAVLIIIGHLGMNYADSSMAMLVVCWAIAAFGQGLICAMPFGMLADTVDYGDWINKVRATGFLTAIGSALCIKAGSGIGGFIPTLIMGNYGYVANEIQSAESLFGINLVFIWVPIILSVIIAVPMFIYARYEAQEQQIVVELQKRANAEAAPLTEQDFAEAKARLDQNK